MAPASGSAQDHDLVVLDGRVMAPDRGSTPSATSVFGTAPSPSRFREIRSAADEVPLLCYDNTEEMVRLAPVRPSEGMHYVLVNGTPVVWQGRIREGVEPGRPVRAPPRQMIAAPTAVS